MSTEVIKADELDEFVKKILDEYGDKAITAMEKAAAGVSKAAANKVKADSPERTGKYKDGWNAKLFKDRVSVEAVVYNSRRPGLTHLLEHGHEIVLYGHALANGGRTQPQVHIYPAEQWAIDEFMSRVKKELG